MHPDADKLWRAPQWTFAVLLALLGMLGPFAIDTYLPAFDAMGKDLGASAVQMQQTLSVYLLCFALMSLFHGAISDSVGRRPVVLWGVFVFTVASAGCALSQTIGQLLFFRGMQGLSTGAGIVVARAIVRDMFAPSQAQKVMSQVTIFFGLAPAIAPMMGGWLLGLGGWHAVFWFLTLVGVGLWSANFSLLPETLHPTQRHPFRMRPLLGDYLKLGRDPRFFLLSMASSIPFNGMFLYVLSAPVFLGRHLGLEPQQFFWFFVSNISGIMLGAFTSGRLAGRWSPVRQIRWGFGIMLAMAVLHLGLNLLGPARLWSSMIPLAVYGFGWALMVPVITLLVLDLHPERRGMASSLQMFFGSVTNGLVAGVLAPWVMHSMIALAGSTVVLLASGMASWWLVRRIWPRIGQQLDAH